MVVNVKEGIVTFLLADEPLLRFKMKSMIGWHADYFYGENHHKEWFFSILTTSGKIDTRNFTTFNQVTCSEFKNLVKALNSILESNKDCLDGVEFYI